MLAATLGDHPSRGTLDKMSDRKGYVGLAVSQMALKTFRNFTGLFPPMGKRPNPDSVEQAVPETSPPSKKVRIDEPVTEIHNTIAEPTGEDAQKSIGAAVVESSAQDERKSKDDQNGGIEAALEDEQDEEDDEEEAPKYVRQTAPTKGYDDLYLDTINRKVLDFDFEKLCSVTLSNINIYACLVCGRYFQGRGPKTPAYFHALNENHHVLINMQTKCVYVLPEGYEVHSPSLDDIKFMVDPWLPKQTALRLDQDKKVAWDLNGKKYTPGFVGMNNLKANDYFNVITQALSHVPPLRNFFMMQDLSSRPQLAQRYGTLVRKIWNPKAFKSHVSPHELLQEIALRSGKRYLLTEQSDPVDFLAWFINNLHVALGGTHKKPKSSIVQQVFQGSLRVESQDITARADAGDRLRFEDADIKSQTQRFMFLTLDLPPAPLFADALDPTNVIPQVPLTTLLCKYDGLRAQERLNTRVRYRLLHPLPSYLIFHVKRFGKNKFVTERNPTIVTFPTRSLDMSPYVEPNPSVHPPGEPIWYDLIANVTHEAVKIRDDSVEGEAERKVWRVHLREKARERWVEVQDLFVEEANAETLFTKESYVQVWEQRKAQEKKGAL